MIKDQSWRAKMKYKKVRILIKKAVEVSHQCNLKINVLIYDPSFRKLTENFTDLEVKQDHIDKIIRSSCVEGSKGFKQRRD